MFDYNYYPCVWCIKWYLINKIEDESTEVALCRKKHFLSLLHATFGSWQMSILSIQ
jgi:hypothetical protein